MCGRVRLSSDYSEIKIRLRFDAAAPAPNYAADWNKGPTRPMMTAIKTEDGKRIARMMRWGLIPRWAKDTKQSYSTFNARAETVATSAAFRDAWKRGQRCLVVVDSFYEWKKLSSKRGDTQPYAIGLADGGPMTLAGLWESWRDPLNGEEVLSCTVITCEPNTVMEEIHDRMPVILGEQDWAKWLGEDPLTPAEAQALLRPCPDDWLKIWPVSKDVGSVKNNSPDLVRPLDPPLL